MALTKKTYPNKRLWILLCLAAFVNSAHAQTPYNWTGAYAGVNLGSVWSSTQLNANNISFLPEDGTYQNANTGATVNPGLQVGYVQQLSGQWVVGAEGDFSYANNSTQFQQSDSLGEFDRFTVRNNLQGSLRLRTGYAIERFLPFITAGVSFASLGLDYTNEMGTSENLSKTTTQVGWILGGGLDYGVLANLSVRTEYLYTDYGKALNLNIATVSGYVDSSGGAQATLASHVVRAAVNYRF
jgi:outer membrane immunogenic protein